MRAVIDYVEFTLFVFRMDETVVDLSVVWEDGKARFRVGVDGVSVHSSLHTFDSGRSFHGLLVDWVLHEVSSKQFVVGVCICGCDEIIVNANHERLIIDRKEVAL